MTVPQKVRKATGMSFKEAVTYYAGMAMSKGMTAKELEIPESTFHRHLTRFGLHGLFLPHGKQRHECRGKGVSRVGSGNRDKIRLYRRQPIVHNGFVWYPGEPTHHCLFERTR